MIEGRENYHTTKVDTHLDERTNLKFHFPDPEDVGRSTVVTCPFFENPRITEDQSANLIRYDVIGRAGNLFGYTGAKSRTLKVEFFMTLPMLNELAANRYKAGLGRASRLTKSEKQDLFKPVSGTSVVAPTLGSTSDYRSYQREYLKKINGGVDPAVGAQSTASQWYLPQALAGNDLEFNSSELDLYREVTPSRNKRYADAVNIMSYWVNLIRSSVLNYEPVPSIGPPIIRLTFGTLYRNIATIASNYSITADDSAGYDVASMLPRRVKINLTLEEVKQTVSRSSVNQIAKKPGVPEEGDANCGYEVITGAWGTGGNYELPSLDPGELSAPTGDIGPAYEPGSPASQNY